MKLQHTLALLAVLAMAGAVDAAMRTFTINSSTGPNAISLIGSPIIEYTDGAFANNSKMGGLELIDPIALEHASTPSITYTLYEIENVFNQSPPRFLFRFVGSDPSLTLLTIRLDENPPFQQPEFADLPDGTDPTATVNLSGTISSASITIGTAAIPEPSAFGFGALALAVTGLGRWLRKRFFAVA
jgi:hypothetical protein